jgi:hypothetical protein
VWLRPELVATAKQQDARQQRNLLNKQPFTEVAGIRSGKKPGKTSLIGDAEIARSEELPIKQ